MSVIIFIIILAVLIFVHELGHFLVAKKSGIRVDEFGLGFPPRLWSKKVGETVYSLNAIPFGGFVKIFGENPMDDKSADENDKSQSFSRKNRAVQAAVLVAGITFNIIFAWIIISIGFMTGLPTSVDETNSSRVRDPRLVITQVLPESPAADAGLKGGDAIISLSAGSQELQGDQITVEEVQSFISSHPDTEIEARVKRGDVEEVISAMPEFGIVEGKPALGISMDMVGIMTLPPHLAFYEGAKLTGGLLKAITVGVADFIASAVTGQAKLSDVTGPVGIAGLVGDASKLGIVYLMSFTAFISLNLAVLNLIPFPALDGGRLLFVLIEAVIRRPVNPKVMHLVNSVGFALLLLLMLVVTYRDIIRLF
ncbi:MAG: RIP metalloprotease RseP [Candidatus Taylorbacteria bacterium RIFCSPLOWO2_12_FULL_43_20]|uniref:Zinc metalloprotease n=1 Tax=Candidatus Taylorbacteria bacterium RIFCSPLOWO2_12_FULL_43_20 TaxID=1802332 RepID=A0A1G2P1K9_9BACT|nr:MAG: RIP metalloprotease RseP [Candidatus Taylorbacteria bacterium RIFCSPHIGHO2_01_FULL_43_120]OHA23884.1 MAG: RIP metalloprotease RseP [Candidatus Taylorbacteria bacterium RIFCSPHIGHO2_02_FULL_43_55]OHA28956.1 MAG: RIP metalloprotease RseP [Candidatus Taylorbacteria bacterium RIFCSPHIGHO2_12_FULL_42_34]OHA31845.1 MAG: RIP metalloprotease RseP [Candidatus Taylorbacteria bacterium RIFCSPLOWO2_01_FULL_43_83]OHA37742.1 MAG: RIP metalloprotease RseP [Candidatus Taylorbacteria bacterium RIFCSPLOW